MQHVAFGGRLVMLGFGSIGQGVLPLILRHIDIAKERITIVTAEPRGREVAAEYGIRFIEQAATRENVAELLSSLLGTGDFLLNLSVDVSSVELMKLCQRLDALYLDTVVEPWAGGYTDPALTPSQRSNYAMREEAIALREMARGGPTSITAHGANPGLVSHFVKQALLDIARDTGAAIANPPPASDRAAWAAIAAGLGIKVIHIAERDTQVAAHPKRPGEFVNTWSVDGFVGEGCQPSELGWGTHEKHFPADGHRHGFGCDAAIYLMRPGAATRVRSWTPLAGPIHGFLITHNESISLADYYTLRDADGAVRYRPTTHYAYHPCDDAVLSIHELAGRNWEMQPEKRLMTDEIVAGMDELGVLLCGHARNAYWYGSRLTIEQARALCPQNNATSLQTAAGVLSGVVWAMRHPAAGIVDPDEMDWREVLAVAVPYLGGMAGVFSEWTPLEGRGELFPEDIDAGDPWQFGNVRV
jgi:homospermidine synthase